MDTGTALARRGLLKGIGVVTVAVLGGAVWRAWDNGVFSTGEGPAYEPWRSWRTDASEGPLSLVRAAILAASPHNTQPWLFKVAADRVDVYADAARNLGAMDPYLREMHLGLGCALENMLLAAAANGFATRLSAPSGRLVPPSDTREPTLVARLELAPAAPAPTPLYDAIPDRHTDRGPYVADRPLSADAAAALGAMADNEEDIKLFLYSGESDRVRFGEAVIAATAAIIGDAAMVADSHRWFRFTWTDIQKYRDGPTVDALGLSPLMRAAAKILPPPSAEEGHRIWLEATRDIHVATAPLFGLIAVRDRYDRPLALRAGRLWQRMHLWATTRDIAMQPLNQPVELVDRERQLGRTADAAKGLDELTGAPDWPATFAFRAGYPTLRAFDSPRRPVADVVI